MIGETIKKLRTDKNYTQKDLAKILGISASAVGMYEQGRREPDNAILIKMSHVFEVSVDEILGLCDQEQAPKTLDEFVSEVVNALMGERITVDGREATQEEIEKIVNSIKLGAEFAKRDMKKAVN
jgi:transcriptional regulator with XRE-family HTH domain